jgi:hypothetical protein
MDTVAPLAQNAMRDLEHACASIDELWNLGSSAQGLGGFELAEASHAARRALIVLRCWERGFQRPESWSTR